MIKNIALVFGLALIMGCSSTDDSDKGGSGTDDFDRSALLKNLADNIIIPAYQDFGPKLTTLKGSIESFVATPNQSTLEAARKNWLIAYKAWQHVEMFNIGKAEALNEYYYFMNIYPVTVSDIENGVSTGNYDLNTPNYHDAQGFPALDYLLYGVAADDAGIVAKFTSDPKAEGYKDYLTDVINRMDNLTQQVITDWTSGYRDQFVNSSKNTATSSLNKFVNDFIFYYEKGLRANKIGIPSGVFSTTPLADKVEGYYNQEVSKALTLEALNAVQDVFNGKSFNGSTTGASFKTYLEYLKVDRNGQNLSAIINAQFNEARTKIEGLNSNFSKQIVTDNTKMTVAYDALQRAVVYLKVDMVQAFNISVDYVDADGD
ncbi:imelysin family protein [Gelidibacter gilvus]|uniref:Peptidase M75 superfamily protein n=1 Tax=Gelidibacter gilvus TaxID=59602 RepID=A0A4Q0XFF5_9FLAO|nr:imelysin family protein [Gelidibacter gilvus]RXJ45804.1 peptidase M75 superfamily protein [Gelidibacter gilvus]